MDVTELGIVTDVILLHPLKALAPILTTPCGMVSGVAKLLQLLKASEPIEELGAVSAFPSKINVCNPVHPEKLLLLMVVTLVPIVTDCKNVLFVLLLEKGLPMLPTVCST